MRACMLTTEDNDHDYFNDFKGWYNFDEQKGYGTCSLLARIARTSDQLSEEENDRATEEAIDWILKYCVPIDKYGNISRYKKVFEEVNS